MIRKHLFYCTRPYAIISSARLNQFVSRNDSLFVFSPLISRKQFSQSSHPKNTDTAFEKKFLANFYAQLTTQILSKRKGFNTPKNESFIALARVVAVEFKSAVSSPNSQQLFATDSFWTALLQIIQRELKVEPIAVNHNLLRFLLENEFVTAAEKLYSYLTRSSSAQQPLPLPTQLLWLQQLSTLPDEDAVFALVQNILKTNDNFVDDTSARSLALSLSRTRRYWCEGLNILRKQLECNLLDNLSYKNVYHVALAALRNGALPIASTLFPYDNNFSRFLPDSTATTESDPVANLLDPFFQHLRSIEDVQKRIEQLQLFLELLNYFYQRFSITSVNALVSHLQSAFPPPHHEIQFSIRTSIESQPRCVKCGEKFVNQTINLRDFERLRMEVNQQLICDDLYIKSNPTELDLFHKFIDFFAIPSSSEQQLARRRPQALREQLRLDRQRERRAEGVVKESHSEFGPLRCYWPFGPPRPFDVVIDSLNTGYIPVTNQNRTYLQIKKRQKGVYMPQHVIQTIQLLADGIGRRSATGPLSSFLIVSRSHVENSLELALQRLLATAPDLYIARFYTNDTSEPNDLLTADDYFTILSALFSGPKCYVVSNDLFREIIPRARHVTAILRPAASTAAAAADSSNKSREEIVSSGGAEWFTAGASSDARLRQLWEEGASELRAAGLDANRVGDKGHRLENVFYNWLLANRIQLLRRFDEEQVSLKPLMPTPHSLRVECSAKPAPASVLLRLHVPWLEPQLSANSNLMMALQPRVRYACITLFSRKSS